MVSDSVVDTLSRPLRDLRISVTDRCNFRCHYCMPSEKFGHNYQFLPRRQLLTFEEITRIAVATARLGVHKLRLTGGEPLLRRDLPHLIAMLHGVSGIDDIALTTNGFLLSKLAVDLKQAGLNRVTVSLDSLNDEVFGRINGRGIGVQKVLEGIAAARQQNLMPVKVNMVVQKGVNDHEVPAMVEHFRGTGVILRFIEYMDVGTLNQWRSGQVVSSRELHGQIHQRYPLEPLDADYPGEVACRYRYRDGQGEIGFISSVTSPFCGGCTRLRLSSDGRLFTCLFGHHGTDIRDPVRDGLSDEALVSLLDGLWRNRRDRYSEERAENSADSRSRVEMYHIGG